MRNIMISLKEAVKLTRIKDDELVYVKYAEESELSVKIYSISELRNTFDMKNTNVIYILPYFMCGEYSGMEFILME